MRTEPQGDGRRIPRTFNRAATSVVQCRSHLDKARDQMTVAIDILSRLDDAEVLWMKDPSERAGRLLRLRALLGQLDDVRQALAVSFESSVSLLV